MNRRRSQSSAQPKSVALGLLARREHSRLELKQKLQMRGFAAEAVALVLDELEAQGWQSDLRFAQQYVRSRIARGYGERHIRSELMKRGVASEVVSEVLSASVEFWQEQLTQVWASHFSGHKPTDYPDQLKQMGFLQRRGFTESQIHWFYKCFLREDSAV